MNAEWDNFITSDCPSKKMISGYLMQKHIKKKKTRNNVPKLDEGDKTYFKANLTFENLCRLDISSSLNQVKPHARGSDSVKMCFLSKPEESNLVKTTKNRAMTFPDKFEAGE
jgi:hypothetical protein